MGTAGTTRRSSITSSHVQENHYLRQQATLFSPVMSIHVSNHPRRQVRGWVEAVVLPTALNVMIVATPFKDSEHPIKERYNPNAKPTYQSPIFTYENASRPSGQSDFATDAAAFWCFAILEPLKWCHIILCWWREKQATKQWWVISTIKVSHMNMTAKII